jgi:hypothetical protein
MSLRQQGAKPMLVIIAARHRCESVSAMGRLVLHKKRRLPREFKNYSTQKAEQRRPNVVWFALAALLAPVCF